MEETELTENEQEKLETELTEIDIARMTPTERRRYRARLRKRKQRMHERAGIPSDPRKKLEVSWSANRAAIMADPEKFAALEHRLFDFQFIRRQMIAVIDRIRRGVHPDVESAGRFYDCIAADVLEHVRQYGLVEFFPPEVLHLPKPSAIEQLIVDPRFHYRVTFGLDIDGLSNLECLDFFSHFFKWYLTNRDNPDYDYEWTIADPIYHSFEIPEKFLTGIFARPWTIWARLNNRRTGISIRAGSSA